MKMRNIAAAAMAGAMAVSLAACGSSASTGTASATGEAADAADSSGDNAPVIGDDLEDDGPAQGAHFGKPCDDR